MWAFHENQVVRIAREAGGAIMAQLADPETLGVQKKADGSNVTNADLTAHKIIMQLGESEIGKNSVGEVLTPGIPVLSEEMSPEQHKAVMKQGAYWCVDPLDGTDTAIKYASGLKDRNGFGVLISLVKNGVPVFGVAHYRAQGQLDEDGKPVGLTYFTSADGKRAYRQEGVEKPKLLPPHKSRPLDKCRIAVSYNEKNPRPVFAGQEMEAFPQAGGGRFLRVAEGAAEVAQMSVYPGYWDIAAPYAIMRARGYEMRTLPPGADVSDPAILAQSESLRLDGRHNAPGFEDKPYLMGVVGAHADLLHALGAPKASRDRGE